MMRLAIWLHEAGQKVVVFVPQNHRMIPGLDEKGVPYILFRIRFKKFPFCEAFLLSQLIAKQGIGTLLTSLSYEIRLLTMVKLFAKNLKVIYFQQMQLGVPKKDFFHTIFYRNLDVWISPLEYLKQQVLANTRIANHQIKVIPLCIDSSLFLDIKAKKSELRKAWNLPSNEIIIGTIGRFDFHKDQITLIEAVGILKSKSISIQVLFVGEETFADKRQYANQLKERIVALEMQDQFHFRPYTSKIEEAHAVLDVFVMSTQKETFGMVTIEAMCSGTPVIGANSGGTAELLEYGKNGILFEPNSPKDLADKILLFLQNQNKYELLADQSKNNMCTKYDKAIEIKEIIDLIE